MTRTRRWLRRIVAVAVGILATRGASAQTSMPATVGSTSRPSSINEGLLLLADAQDGAFSFDDPGFYWFCQHVGAAEAAVGDVGEPLPWRFLLERPSDYRGALVTIEGRLLRREAFEVANRPGVGRLHQCDLGEVGTRAICTAIVIDEPTGIAIGERVRLRGYFIKVRAFRTMADAEGVGPLVVARRLEALPRAVADAGSPGMSAARPVRWIAGGTATLFLAWVALRRYLRVGADRAAAVPGSRSITNTPRDFDWLTRRDGDDPAERA